MIVQHGCNSNSEQLLQEYSVALLDAFAKVFDITLLPASGDPGSLGVDPEPAADARHAVDSNTRFSV